MCTPQQYDDPGMRLQRAFSELADLKQALAAEQRELQAALLQLETMRELNADLNRELARLARSEAEARDFAHHDELTRLPNRRLLRDRLEQALSHAARQRKRVALLLIDLDGFKCVNDKLGHARGDQLLQAVAQRLQVNVRAEDTACRYGGDEFVVMLPEVGSLRSAATVATKLRAAMRTPYWIDGHEICVTASIGAVVYPADGQTYEELLRKADEALYRAKPAGRKAAIEARAGNGGSPTSAAAPNADGALR